jgi:transposase
MSNSLTPAHPDSPGLFVGIDWADQKHDVHWITADGRRGRRQVEQSPEQIEELVAWMIGLADGKPIALALEKSRGPLQYALLFRDGLTLYPIDPKQLASYRNSFTSSGAKSDLDDAALLARLLQERYRELSPLRPDDEPTRRLAHLCQTRRSLVDENTRLKLQLQALLKTYFPLLLTLGTVDSSLVQEVLRRWPDPRQFRRVHPKILDLLFWRHGERSEERRQQMIERVRSTPLLTHDGPLIESLALRVAAIAGQLPPLRAGLEKLEKAIDQAMAAHPDAEFFRSLPGAGRALAPRLLAAFGSDRSRYAHADEVAVVSGIAPVTKQSGKTRLVVRRRACSRFLKQTFHEFADAARKWCPWSKAYYQLQRSRQTRHHAAIRKLASRWIRILFRVWLTRTPYDPDRYLQRLRDTQHPLLAFLTTAR